MTAPSVATPARAPRWHLPLLLLAALAVRGVYLAWPSLTSDNAVVGLMGLAFLRGEPSTLYWGQPYGGSLESLVAAGLFGLLGANAYTLNLASILISLLYVWGAYLCGRLLWGSGAGLLAGLLAALGPYLHIWYSVQALGVNVGYLAAGQWLIYLTLRLLRTTPGQPAHTRLFAALGLVAGLGVWYHFLTAYTLLACSLILWRRDPLVVFRPAAWLAVAAFFLGSTPLWIYNLTHDWGSYYYLFVHSPFQDTLENSLRYLWGLGLPELYSLAMPWPVQPWDAALGALDLVMAVGVTGAILGAWGRKLWDRALGRETNGEEVLLLALLVTMVVFTLSGASRAHTSRYMLSFYNVWPLAIAWACRRLWDARPAWRRLGWGLAGFATLFFAYSSLMGSPLFWREAREHNLGQLEDVRRVVAASRELGLRHVYTPDYWLASVLTFTARESILFPQPFFDRNPEYMNAARRDPAYGYLVNDYEYEDNRTQLAALGLAWQETKLPGKVLLHHFAPPAAVPRFLDRDRLVVTGQPNPGLGAQALDACATTRWTTGGPQAPGQRLLVDLGQVTPGVCQLVLLGGREPDLPQVLTVSASDDGQTWRLVARLPLRLPPWSWDAGNPVLLRDAPWQELRFAPQGLRYLRLEQDGDTKVHWWSELEVLVGAARADARRPDPAAAAAWLLGLEDLAGPILTGLTLQAHLPPQRRARLSWARHPPWLREYLDPGLVLPLEPLNLVVEDRWWPVAERVLALAGWTARHRQAHGYHLLQATPPAGDQRPADRVDLRPRPWEGAQVWDLGERQEFRRLEFFGEGGYLPSQNLRLSRSDDGAHWTPVAHTPRRAPRLYWATHTPLATQGWPLVLETGPQTARYLRLEPGPGLELPPRLWINLWAR